MWNAAQGGTYPFPYTQAAVLREADGSLIDEAFIWSPDVAFQYPSAAVNGRGDVAGTISLAGPQTFVSVALWISDDVNGHSLSPLENELVLTGSHSPTGNRWGDFFTTRPHSRLTNLWGTVAVADTLAANGAEPHYILFGRSRDGAAPSSPVANFTFSPNNPRVGQAVNFRDLSLGAPTSWSWDYADGRSSTLESPVHVFGAASTYNVTLTAESSAGSSVVTKPVVVLSAAPRAPSIGLSVVGAQRDPVFDSYDGSVGQAITFTASETDANQWLWDFGDGTSASGKSVVKTYASSGTMLGHLTVYGDGVATQVGPLTGNFTMSIALPIRPPPSGAYTVLGLSRDRQTGDNEGAVGVAITFEAAETHASQYLWYFGDGTAASGRVVTKEFTRAGAWTVKLVVFGDGITTAIGPTVVAIPVKVIPCTRCTRTVPFR
jgi:PKD repeat protein